MNHCVIQYPMELINDNVVKLINRNLHLTVKKCNEKISNKSEMVKNSQYSGIF